jgi:Na+/H+ antiporter NhaD/arsenite permease-like protein
MGIHAYFACAIFLISYIAIVMEKWNRMWIAIGAAGLMMITGVIRPIAALHFIDLNTIGLLIGMMIIVSITAETGIFQYFAVLVAKAAKGNPIRLLVYLMVLTAIFSAFLDNVTTVLLFIPVTIQLAKQLKLSPVPFLIAEVFASNLGGTATLIGDPPNMMIGNAVKELSFLDFINQLSPIVLLLLVIVIFIFVRIYRKTLQVDSNVMNEMMRMDTNAFIHNKVLLWKSGSVLVVTLVGFFIHDACHLPIASIALGGALLLVILAGDFAIGRIIRKVEWSMLFFFIGLFMMIGGLVETGVIDLLARKWMAFTQGDEWVTAMGVLWFSALLSAFVDNIPLVTIMIPLVKQLSQAGMMHTEAVWWSLALGSCLGGNGTIIGASANIIASDFSRKLGQPITFRSYFKLGFPIMILTILLSSGYILLKYFG